jgi:prepilin-type N-terminal cleavage/methylation domain-containing protein
MCKNAGYSFVEVMTVIAILSILAGIVIPNYISWRANAQLNRATLSVYSILQKAKSEAVKRNALCAVTFGADEYTVYMDNGNLEHDAGEAVISSNHWSQYPGVNLDGTTFNNPVDSIAFAPDGLPRDNTHNLGSGDVMISYQGNRQKTIEVSIAGTIRVK